MFKKILFVVLICFVLIGGLAACSPTQEGKDSKIVQSQQEIYAKNQPIPIFNWSQDRDNLIQIYVAKNEARNTFSAIASMTGETKFLSPTIGFPLPADIQLTNPLQVVGNSYGSVVEQAEPNGLFSSKNTDATYILAVRKNGDVVPIYSEFKVTAFPFAVKVDPATGMWNEVDVDSESTIKINMNRKPKDLPILASESEANAIRSK
ncbi:MAG: hypothetical protein WCG91_03210 [Candidatus Shapirobacteria bacterium]